MSRFVLLVVLLVIIYRVLPRLWRGVLAGISGGTSHGPVSKPAVQMVRDPVCGTFVVPDRSVALSLGDRQLHFCSTTCRDSYRARPS
jgi:YHS domain-containing protein